MKNQAFTLIELLVVVLIIGILAAIAVPQYQKAVKKSRAVEALLNLKSLIKAQKVFHLANGSYTRNLDDLDIKLNSIYYTYNCLTEGNDAVYCYARPMETNGYYFQMTYWFETYCRGTKESCSFISTDQMTYGSDDSYFRINLSAI